MSQRDDQCRINLIKALRQSDSLRRASRADRIEWLSLHTNHPSFIAGRAETLRLLQEARETFVDGYFVGTLMIAMAVIEHTIVEDLQFQRLTQRSPTFAQAVRLAADKKLFPPDWLERATRLSYRRNPFAHLKEEGHSHSLGARIQSEKRHPHAILEDDAKDALELMYNFFTATLSEWPAG